MIVGCEGINQAPAKKNVVVVGISDLKVSNHVEDVLVTYSLGSCVGVTAYDPFQKVGGLIHCKLPAFCDTHLNRQMCPACFVDIGIPLLIERVIALGAAKARLQVNLIGGGDMYDDKGIFAIGKKNIQMARHVLHSLRLPIQAEEVGGFKPRTVSLHIADGKTFIKSGNVMNEVKKQQIPIFGFASEEE